MPKHRKGLYILTNTVNGKKYVGMDTALPRRANLHLRGHASCPAIRDAIAEFGAENFDLELIDLPNLNHVELCNAEKSKIQELGTQSPHGYNLKLGGGRRVEGKKHRIQIAEKLYLQGWSRREIADELGVNPDTVSGYLGTAFRPRVTNKMLREMLRLYGELGNWSEVARKLGTVRQVINYWKKVAKDRGIK